VPNLNVYIKSKIKVSEKLIGLGDIENKKVIINNIKIK